MSIRRNNRLFNRGDTIVRTSPIPLTDGLTTSYYTNRYVRLNNRYFTPPSANWYNNAGNTVIIKAEIPETATGYFFGVFDASSAMTIRKSGSNIIWKIGTTEHIRAWQPGVHLYGFSEGKAWYDNVFLTTTPYTGSVPVSKITIGGTTNAGSTPTYECISEIDIYEVFLSAPYTNGATTKTVGRLYAAREGAGGTKAWLFEMRRSLYAWDSYGSGTATLGDAVTYGIQLHDLKEAFGSGYCDLIAMMAGDNPDQAAADADAAYIVKKGTETHAFAFLLNDGLTSAPLPADYKHEGETGGATAPERTKTRPMLGELIYGRRPKWKLWADNINVGKNIINMSGRLQYIYNIFLPKNGQGRPNLEQWEGYTTGPEYAPAFELSAGIYEIEYHNGIPCKCDPSSMVPLFVQYTPSDMDNGRVYFFNQEAASGKMRAKLGNLVDWHLTAEQQGVDNLVFGMACVIEHKILIDQEYIYTAVAAAYLQTKQQKVAGQAALMPLSSGSDAETVNLFKKGKLADGETDAEMDLSLTGRDETHLYRDLYAAPDHTIDVNVVLAAIRSSIPLTSAPSGLGLVHTDYVVPVPTTQLQGDMDPKQSAETGVTDYRCLLMDGGAVKKGAATYYVYPVVTGANSRADTIWPSGGTAATRGFGFVFALIDKAWTVDAAKVDATTLGTFYIAIETLSNNAGTFSKGRYCKVLGLYSTSDDNPATGSLTNISGTYLPNGNRLLTLYQEQADAQKYVLRQWFPQTDVPAMFLGDTLNQSTTVKVWIRHSTDERVLVKYSALSYHSKCDAWKLSYLTVSRLMIDGTAMEIGSRTGILRILFSSWNVSGNEQAGTETYSPREINTTVDAKKLKITVYEQWDDVNSPICTAIFKNGSTGYTLESGTAGWEYRMIGSGHFVNDPNTGLVSTDYYGYEITILPTGSTTWPSAFAFVIIEPI